jgi:hypothetical protein
MGSFGQTLLAGRLHFGDSDGTFRADLYTGFTTKTLIGLNRLGLAVNHLENLCRAGIHTFLITDTLVFIYNYFPHLPNLRRVK